MAKAWIGRCNASRHDRGSSETSGLQKTLGGFGRATKARN
jgi:hypothetical protein